MQALYNVGAAHSKLLNVQLAFTTVLGGRSVKGVQGTTGRAQSRVQLRLGLCGQHTGCVL